MWRILRIILIGVLIMARGAPDDSNVKVGKDVFRLDDLAELAVRIGSPVTYNRAGNVLLIDGFESGISAWKKGLFGVGVSIEASNELSYEGGTACRMESGTGATPLAQINRFIPVHSPCRMGFQVFFAPDDDLYSFRIAMLYGLAPNTHNFTINYRHTTGELHYYTAGPAFLPLASPGIQYHDSNNWHNMKLVVDTETGEYVRLYFDDVAYDMAGLLPYTQVRVDGPMQYVSIHSWGTAIQSGNTFVDSVIVTYNEF